MRGAGSFSAATGCFGAEHVGALRRLKNVRPPGGSLLAPFPKAFLLLKESECGEGAKFRGRAITVFRGARFSGAGLEVLIGCVFLTSFGHNCFGMR